ncbi:hypothetical protein [Psychromonas sp. 14N.309.X.WAT.B.A12]|uniref:hypothetical protein n=1 Tax=unclassified Psychromonas TaxID=2614957 RepID=UPI0025B0C52A|nr:hypothetical protein [Psychromonas sp. 14N.309.X.WAT.B.A12]MDN2662308.1 hypothetical protein [Psychromonas sp. 14N.309.X.WAT.B.A12]
MSMLDEVMKVLTYYHGENNFNMNPLVPKDVEHYARAVLDIPDDEYILAAMRTSFTQFHRGIVIGRDAIYWRNDHKVITSVNKLTWNELSQQKEQFRARRRTVELGNGAIFDNIGSLNKTSIIINLLDLLIDRYQSQNSPAEGFIFDEKEMVELVRSIPNNKEELKKQCAESAADAETVSFLSILGSIFKKIIGR